jgi:hypothetical protein
MGLSEGVSDCMTMCLTEGVSDCMTMCLTDYGFDYGFD